MRNYDFLLFDADNTLLDFDADMHAAFAEMYEAAGLCRQKAYSSRLLSIYNEYNNLWWSRFEKRECTKNELYVGRYRDFLQEAGLEYDPEKLNALYFSMFAKGGRCLPGALSLVQQLAENGYRLYIVTNGNAAAQEYRLQHAGFADYILDCFVSETAGAAKPDLRYFTYCFEKIEGFVPARSIVIGDSLTSDIQGAVNAGLDSIWYNPFQNANKTGISPTYEVQSLTEIPAVLEAQ